MQEFEELFEKYFLSSTAESQTVFDQKFQQIIKNERKGTAYFHKFKADFELDGAMEVSPYKLLLLADQPDILRKP